MVKAPIIWQCNFGTTVEIFLQNRIALLSHDLEIHLLKPLLYFDNAKHGHYIQYQIKISFNSKRLHGWADSCFFFVKTIVNNSKSLHIQNAIFTFSDIVKINTIFTMLAQSTKLKKQDKN
jgi:hypothetical protein